MASRPHRVLHRRPSVAKPRRNRNPVTHRILSWASISGYVAMVLLGISPMFQMVGMRASATLPFQQAQANFLLSQLVGQNQIQRGNQVVVNGTRLPLEWSFWNNRVGISDVGFWQLMGLELLDTRDPQQQPVRWFTDPVTQALVLQAWNDGQFRYLDVAPIATTFNWQVSRSGNSLQITTPAAQVLSVRQGRQSWGDRFVIDLDRPTTWQVTEQTTGVEISMDGTFPLPPQAILPPPPGNTYQSYQIQQRGTKTVIQIQGTSGIRPVVFTLPNPYRLVVDLRSEVFPNRDIQWSPGIRWRSQLLPLGSSTFPVTWLEINPRQPNLQLRPIWTNSATQTGITPLVTMARQSQAAAAINAGFFNRNNQLPLGAIRRDSRWFSGPILNRGAIAWNAQGEVLIDRLTLRETLQPSGGNPWPLFSLNSGYVGSGISRYTPEWGTTYTPILNNETLFTVRQNQVVDQALAGVAGQGVFAIPADGYLLVSRGTEGITNQFPLRTPVQVQQGTVPPGFEPFPQIVGAGPLLVRDRQVVLNAAAEQFSTQFAQQQAPRSAIARTANGTILLIAAQNRIGGRGPSLTEMAQITQSIGAIDALNLDGGSSTSLYLGGRLINRSPLTAARVHNGIGIFLTSPP